MRRIDILTSFETEINKLNDEVSKPATDDSLFWLNQGVNKFVKLRFNGDFAHKTGYEQTEKRRADLIKLFRSTDYDLTKIDENKPSYDLYRIKYPEDFMYALNEDVVITDLNDEHELDTCVFECTQDSFMYRVNNSLTDFHYRSHRARPIRTRNSEGCLLLTDKKYKIKKYTLGYLKTPSEITLGSNPAVDAFEEYEDFDDATMYEIIKIAAQMYLENQKDERYQTITAEVMTQE